MLSLKVSFSLIDRNLFKKFLVIFFSTYLIFIALYIIGFTIDNLDNFYANAKNKSVIPQLYKYNILIAVFYVFPFTVIFSLVLLYLLFYLRRENISIFTIGYRCNIFKKCVLLTLLILAGSIFLYYDIVFTTIHTKNKKLSIKINQSNKHYNSILTINKNNNTLYIFSKVFNIKNKTMDNVYFYNIVKNFEIFARKATILKNNIIFKKVKLFKGFRWVNKNKLILFFPDIQKELTRIFTTIEGLNAKTLINFYKITKNRIFLFELFRRITYILNGTFIAIILIYTFSNIIVKMELLKYLSYFILFTIFFVSLYFLIFLLAKNLHSIHIGIILWLWNMIIFYIANNKLILLEQ